MYVLICTDRPATLPLRTQNRAAHLAHIETTGVVRLAGPFLDEGGAMCGSLIVHDVATRAEAEAWSAADPYAQAGLFERVEVRAWRKVVG
jgi:hypothetical protein